MKTFFATTALALIAATTAYGSSMTDSIVKQLTDQGYTHIEMTVGPNQVKAEAVKGGVQREMVFDKATGKVLKDSTDAVQAGDDTSPGVDVGTAGDDFVKDDPNDDSGDDATAGDGAGDDNGDDSGDDSGSDGDGGSDGGSDGDGGSDNGGNN